MDEPRKTLEHREDEQGEPLTPGQSRAFTVAHAASCAVAARVVPENLLSDKPVPMAHPLTFAEFREYAESIAMEAALKVACELLEEDMPPTWLEERIRP